MVERKLRVRKRLYATIIVDGDLSEPQRIWLDDAIVNTPWNHQALTKLGETLQQAFGVTVRLERPKSNSPGWRAA
jgi:hypothetical protein